MALKENQVKRWKFGTGMKVHPLVDAACCLANGNKLPDGSPMFDVETHFDSWVRIHVREKLEVQTNPTNQKKK